MFINYYSYVPAVESVKMTQQSLSFLNVFITLLTFFIAYVTCFYSAYTTHNGAVL